MHEAPLHDNITLAIDDAISLGFDVRFSRQIIPGHSLIQLKYKGRTSQHVLPEGQWEKAPDYIRRLMDKLFNGADEPLTEYV